jgi:hypothetical protein
MQKLVDVAAAIVKLLLNGWFVYFYLINK